MELKIYYYEKRILKNNNNGQGKVLTADRALQIKVKKTKRKCYE